MPSDLARASPLAPGSKLDGYELLWPIGEGGMATVWVARLLRKHGFEKLVAIKTILPKFAEDEAFQTMFLDEARIASRIDHTNVAHIHDLGEKDDILYLVMEYVDGDALTRLRKIVNRRGGTFPIGIALRIMADVCAGLHAAHELKGVDGTPLGVVHRDVSPQNILVTTDGTSKLIDFGVAKAAGRLTAETHTGQVKGKVQYMAPEQALGGQVDRRADVWAVGAVIYHLVANRPPFEADNQLALLNLLQKGRPPSGLPAHVPIPVQDIVRKALTHNPMMRFQTAAEMRSAIERTGLAATTEEVSELVRTHLGDVAERRRDAIASAILSLEGTGTSARRIAPAPTMPTPGTPITPITEAGSTQRLGPSQLPAPQAYAVPPSYPQIGPPTPPSFASAPPTGQTRHQDPRRTEPVVVAALSPYPSSGSTEPLPPPEVYDHAFNDHTSGGGSLGLASTSSSISTRGPRRIPLIAAAIGGAAVLVGVLALAVSVSRGGSNAKKLESEFSPLPSSAPAASTATAMMTAVPPPPAAEDLPAAPEPARTPTPTQTPAPVAHPAPVATPVLKPAPAASAKKPKPRVDDGF